ncbi:MAG: hypothetical protein ACTHJ8_18020, partial [Mucilaginibacter sp.]
TSIVITLVGIAIIVFCQIYFRPAINLVDSDTMSVTPEGIRSSRWPLFIGILTTFVGIVFYLVATHDKTAKRK